MSTTICLCVLDCVKWFVLISDEAHTKCPLLFIILTHITKLKKMSVFSSSSSSSSSFSSSSFYSVPAGSPSRGGNVEVY